MILCDYYIYFFSNLVFNQLIDITNILICPTSNIIEIIYYCVHMFTCMCI